MIKNRNLFHTNIIAALCVMMFVFQGCESKTANTPKSAYKQKKAIADNSKDDKAAATTVPPTTFKIDHPEKVQVVDTKRFTEEVCEIDNGRYGFKATMPVLVDFYADWCRPCSEIAPYLVEFAEKYAGQIIIYKVNVDKCAEIASAFNLTSIPTLIFYKPGEQPQMHVGAPTKDELEKTIQTLLLS